jgi:hypothetical protein
MSTPRFTVTDPSKTPALDPRITHDAATGLDWQTVPFPHRMTWAEADAACTALRLGGHDDWRLPTRAEMLTLVDDTRHNPAIDTEAFPDTPLGWFWTATPYAGDPCGFAWIVNFDIGGSSAGARDRHNRARAVRGTHRQFSASLEG